MNIPEDRNIRHLSNHLPKVFIWGLLTLTLSKIYILLKMWVDFPVALNMLGSLWYIDLEEMNILTLSGKCTPLASIIFFFRSPVRNEFNERTFKLMLDVLKNSDGMRMKPKMDLNTYRMSQTPN